MKDAVVRARVASDLKKEAEDILDGLGLTSADAIRMLLTQIRLRRGLPFPVTLPTDNDDLLVGGAMRQAAMEL
ncbi:type II toxin-antitoxin system RelB/DinJ family antitoxin [Haloferula sargassicola]